MTDLEREFHLARSNPRHPAPQPKLLSTSSRTGQEVLLDSFLGAQHALEMFRLSLPPDAPRKNLDRLSNRLTKIVSIVRTLESQ